ncbi:hypothetical protein D6C87_09759 [Aureobasidium pullulans]|nr:hypothetical protein D6C87_09759 [Aureobasidium pullulans]
MTAAPGRNPEAGDYTIECPGHGIRSSTKAHIASGLRVSRLGIERHQTRVATPNGYGRVCGGETVMAQILPHRLQELESWMCKRLIHVGAMDGRYRMTARMRFGCEVVVMCLGVWVWSCVRLQFATLRTDQVACGEMLSTILLVPQYAMRSKCDRLSKKNICGVVDDLRSRNEQSDFSGRHCLAIRFGFLSKLINRRGSAWRQEQAQNTQDTSKIDFIPEIANSTRCRKSSSTNCSKQGGEHDKPSFAAQFTGSCSTLRSGLPGSNLEHTRCNRRDKELTKNRRNEKEDDAGRAQEGTGGGGGEQAAPACGASRNSNAGRILHLPSFLDLDFDLDISDFRLATRPHVSLGLRRSSVRTSRTTRDDTCNTYDFFGHPEIGRRHCANLRCQSGSVDAHKCYQCWANVITTTTTTALVQMT